MDIIQSALLVNSTLVIKLCRSLETLLDNHALSEKNIDFLIILINILRKDIDFFYEILDGLNNLPSKDVKIIDNYLESEREKYNKDTIIIQSLKK